jgi:ABC-type multidrug transport system fused ATPase/permease subunit
MEKPASPPSQPEKRMSFREVAWRILQYLRPYPLLVTGVFFYLAISIGLDLAGPKILGTAIDTLRLSPGLDEASRAAVYRSVAAYGVGFLALGFLAQLSNFRKELLRTRLNTTVLCDLRVQLYSALQGLCFRFHDANRTGELITKTTRDIYRIHNFYAETIFLAAEFLFIGGGAAVLIGLSDIRLALLAFSTFPFAILVIWRTATRLREMSREVGDRYDEVTQVLQESIAGVRVVKAFAKESLEIDKFEGRIGAFLSRVISTADYFTLNLPLAGTLFNLSIPLTLGGGGLLVLRGSVGLGALVAALFYLMKIGTLMRVMNRIVQTTEEAAASADRVFAILDAEPHVTDRPQVTPLPPAGKGRVVFEGVRFSYRPGLAVLHDIDLTVEPGETIGIVGPTGAGKTTLMALIPRFYEVDAGRVLIDGVDVRDVRLEELRQAVSAIFQDTFLFSASVAENIAYGRPGTPREEVERAARAAQIHDFIAGLEQGYDARVGERGINLSGGQKQRLTIARAILLNPRVLIMDDSTASVDARTERRLQEAMAALARGRTTFIIAQRLSSVLAADRIVLLDDGRISAVGTHPQLLLSSRLYADMHRRELEWSGRGAAEVIR